MCNCGKPECTSCGPRLGPERLEALVSQFGVTVSKYRGDTFVKDLDNFPLAQDVPYTLHLAVTFELNKRGWSLGTASWEVTVKGGHIELTHRVWNTASNRPPI